MRLTDHELTILASVFTLTGIAFGSLLTRITARASAREALRQQRQLEGDRRRDDRRARLYEDMLAMLGSVSRAATATEPDVEKVKELIDSLATVWISRVDLFASSEVAAVFENWFDAFAKLWGVRGKKANDAAEYERWQGWERQTEENRAQLPLLMRRELESWGA